MPGYLDSYEPGADQRERLIKRIVVGVLLVAIIGVTLYCRDNVCIFCPIRRGTANSGRPLAERLRRTM